MDEKLNRAAALANIAAYDAQRTKRYVDGAPHIKHDSLRRLYTTMVVDVFEYAQRRTQVPRVLDLGAGEGSTTLAFLELGARVTAVDVSASQLEALRFKCARYVGSLDTRCEDIKETLRQNGAKYDVVVLSSFLHHVPDYLGMLVDTMDLLTPSGQIFSFQDPLRYDSLNPLSFTLSRTAYLSWRLLKGDLVDGMRRHVRRTRGVYLAESVHDNAEYHVVRNGVDHEALASLFRQRGFECHIVSYFATQSRFWQKVGTFLRAKNYFAAIARRHSEPVSAG